MYEYDPAVSGLVGEHTDRYTMHREYPKYLDPEIFITCTSYHMCEKSNLTCPHVKIYFSPVYCVFLCAKRHHWLCALISCAPFLCYLSLINNGYCYFIRSVSYRSSSLRYRPFFENCSYVRIDTTCYFQALCR